MGISTHILDTGRGRPAAGVAVTLHRLERESAVPVGRGETDTDGRLGALLPEGRLPEPGTYLMRFEVGEYFARLGAETFYPFVEIAFTVRRPEEHHHVPLLLAPHAYTTYRGS